MCSRSDLTLTRNGRVRSHAANGKKAGPDNPACPGGSDYPAGHSEAAVAPATATGGPNPFRPPIADHRHRYEYGDDNKGHSGSFCSVCGDEEPDDPSTAARSGAPVHTLAPGDRNHDGPRTDADAFLDGEPGGDDDDGGSGSYTGPPYVPAKYDGSCDTCGGHLNAGDMIRSDRMGGWEGEDCCGDDATPDYARPVKVARTLPVKNGRYVFPHPLTGKLTRGSRASKYAEGIADSFALSQWQLRMALLGMALRPDLVDKVMSAIGGGIPHQVAKEKKTYLDKLSEEARLAAGSKDRAHHGTKLHKHTEELDGGTRVLADVPDTYRLDATAYVDALEHAGFRPVKHLIERSVFTDELGVVGTFDRVLECFRDTEVVDLGGRKVQIKAGEYVIGDVKSGTDLKYAWPEILVQMAIYAHAVNENGIAVYDPDADTDPDDVISGWGWSSVEEQGAGILREDVGVVMHVPFGEGRADLRYADLITGWRGAKLCQANREYFKVKMPKEPVMSLMPTDVPGAAFVKELAAAVGDPGTAFVKPSASQLTGHPSVKAGIPVNDQKEDQMPDTDPWPTMEDRFRAATTREEANQAWRDARAAGVPAAELARLVALVDLTPVPPSWDERAAAVATREQASALFREARAAVMEGKPDMNVAKLNALTSIMRDALAKTG